METDQGLIPLTSFNFEEEDLPVSFVETMKVAEGVKCDVYTFAGDTSKDLGIIRIKPGKKLLSKEC